MKERAIKQDETGRPGRVIVKHVNEAYVDEAAIDAQWRELNYPARPDFAVARAQYDHFAKVLRDAGAELHYLPADGRTGLDAIYPRDAAVICERGAILCSMGKSARRGEPAAMGEFLEELDVPVHARISGDGRLEGGDVVWLGSRAVAVGHGYRTNAEGIRQLRAALTGLVDDFLVVPLPHWHGPDDVFHLMSMISPVADGVALVYSPLLPVPFRERLLAMNIALIEVPAAEFETQACNVLALGARRVLMQQGNPVTRSRLEAAGLSVAVYSGTEISLKGGGGPTCLTRPIERYS